MLVFESYEKAIQFFIAFFTIELNKFHQRKLFCNYHDKEIETNQQGFRVLERKHEKPQKLQNCEIPRAKNVSKTNNND